MSIMEKRSSIRIMSTIRPTRLSGNSGKSGGYIGIDTIMKCAKCKKDAEGYKCAICGEESKEDNPKHTHGEPASPRHCMPCCKECKEAEVHCTC